MIFHAVLADPSEVLPLREQYRAEMNCQIVHDSIHRRAGWTCSWLLMAGGHPAGFGSVTEGGPWKDRPTLFEFFVVPDYRTHVFQLFELLLATGQPQAVETQSNSPLLTTMLHAFCHDVVSEKILFTDAMTTRWPSQDAVVQRVTSLDHDRSCFAHRDGGTEWKLMLRDEMIGRGGVLFHYNVPYGDVYMEIFEPYRQHGYGVFLVQELKRICRDLGGTPAARCSPNNLPSRQTCQKAGFVPVGHLLKGHVS